MAQHPATSHPEKIKPSLHVDLAEIKGLSQADIDDQVTLTVKGKVTSLSKDSFEGPKTTRIGIEISSIETQGKKPNVSMPGHRN